MIPHWTKHSSALTTIEVTIISAVTIVLGIFLAYVASSWYYSSSLEATEEVDKNVQIVHSALVIEQVSYNYEENMASLTVRNVAKNPLNLVVFRVELASKSGLIHGSLTLTGNNVLRPGESLNIKNVPKCSECHKGDQLIYRVWYTLERYASDSLEMFREATFAETSFVYAGGEIFLACPPPTKNLIIDIVDPVLNTDGWFTQSNTIYIRPALGPTSTTTISATVKSLSEDKTAHGMAENVQVPSSEQVKIRGNFFEVGIGVPFKILIDSPDMVVIQREWILAGTTSRVFVTDITLLWKETDRTVHTIVLTLAARNLPKDVYVKAFISLKNCNEQIIGQSMATALVPAGSDTDLPIFISLPRSLSIDQIYSVETKIVEVD